MTSFFSRSITVIATCLVLASCDASNQSEADNNSISDKTRVSSARQTLACTTADNKTVIPQPLSFRIVAKYPHDTNAFTQGLVYHNGYLYESTGLYGKSSLRKQRLGEAQPLAVHAVEPQYFAEGLTLFNKELIQLTWKAGAVFRYSPDSLTPVASGTIAGEGWGLTHNGKQLITSDGSAQLSYRDPVTLETTRTLPVTFAGRQLSKLNELEWANGCLFANIWHNDHIAVIAPDTGTTLYTIDLSTLAAAEKQRHREHVTNGIAYRPDTNTLLVTGKNWQWLYEIELSPRELLTQ